jgi:hypothetical protein
LQLDELLPKLWRIKQAGKQNRDLFIDFLYDTGWYVNSEIEAQFGLTCSAVSRRVDTNQKLLDFN